jgi:hypothetical protein
MLSYFSDYSFLFLECGPASLGDWYPTFRDKRGVLIFKGGNI